MKEYKKGWYSIAKCEELDPKKIVDYLEDVNSNSSHKIQSSKSNGNGYELTILSKNFISVSQFINGELIKEKIEHYKITLLDYFNESDILLINTSINHAKPILKFLSLKFDLKIVISEIYNLKRYWKEIHSLNKNSKLLESQFFNVSFPQGSVGRVKLDYIKKRDFDEFFEQEQSVISWIKLKTESNNENLKMEFFNNGTFYISKNITNEDILPIITFLSTFAEE